MHIFNFVHFLPQNEGRKKKKKSKGSYKAPALSEAETLHKVQYDTAQISSAARVKPVINIYISYQIQSSAADLLYDFRQVTKPTLICLPACRERHRRQGAGRARCEPRAGSRALAAPGSPGAGRGDAICATARGSAQTPLHRRLHLRRARRWGNWAAGEALGAAPRRGTSPTSKRIRTVFSLWLPNQTKLN